MPMTRRAPGAARLVVPPAAHSVNNNYSTVRRSVPPRLAASSRMSSLLVVAAITMVCYNRLVAAEDDSPVSLSSRTLLGESSSPPPRSPPETSRRLTGEHRAPTSDGTRSAITSMDAGYARASHALSEELPLLRRKSARSLVALAPHNGSLYKPPSRRRLTQATSNYSQIAKLRASDPASFDNFGNHVAISGDTLVVGVRYDDDKGTNSGSAYIFTRDLAGSLRSSWTRRAKLLASDGAADDAFGLRVAINGDTVVVGTTAGSAYIFTRNVAGSLTAGWTQRAKLSGSDGGGGQAISGDTLAVGGYKKVRIFTRDVAGSLTAGWTFHSQVSASGDGFGRGSVAISGDTLVVAAPYYDDRGSNRGSAYIFTRNVGQRTEWWVRHAKLLAADGVVGDRFGRSVAISGDTVVVGAQFDDDRGADSGSAYIFTRNIAGNLRSSWTQRAKLLASDGVEGDWFGSALDIGGDTVVVGAWGSSSGSAYIFTRNVAGSLTSTWTQHAKLLGSDPRGGDGFGVSVAISGDTVAVGAFGDEESVSEDQNSGSAYVFATIFPPPSPLPPPPSPVRLLPNAPKLGSTLSHHSASPLNTVCFTAIYVDGVVSAFSILFRMINM